MAFTVTTISKTVFGNKRVVTLDVTADAATQNVAPGLAFVEAVLVTPWSLTTAAIKVKPNIEVSGGAASLGNVAVSGAVNGDRFFITAIGR